MFIYTAIELAVCLAPCHIFPAFCWWFSVYCYSPLIPCPVAVVAVAAASPALFTRGLLFLLCLLLPVCCTWPPSDSMGSDVVDE